MLYLDASALVKRYVDEDGSRVVRKAIDGAHALSTCRLCFVETVRAVGLSAGVRGIRRVEGEWQWFDVVDVDQALAERAATLALSHRLRALDALHLAAVLSLSASDVTFATWDARLHRAARAEGLATLPAKL